MGKIAHSQVLVMGKNWENTPDSPILIQRLLSNLLQFVAHC
jgi:hypothetical protein